MIALAALFMTLPMGNATDLSRTSSNVAVTAPDVQGSERALTLAKLLNSATVIFGNDRSDAKALKLVTDAMSSDATFSSLESHYPGISLEIAHSLLAIGDRSENERLPVLWQRQADLYRRHFTADELSTLIAFYGSATGQKMIAGVIANIRPSAVTESARTSGDFSVSPDAVISDIRATVPTVFKQMNIKDKAVLAAFARSGLFARIKQLAPETQAIVLTWADERAPWQAEETRRVVRDIIARHKNETAGAQPSEPSALPERGRVVSEHH